MRTSILSLAVALAGSTVAVAQTTVITPPSGGIAIVNGGHYSAGTTFVNGMAYPAGTVIQANAAVRPGLSYVAPAVAAFGYGQPSYGNAYRYSNPGYYSGYGMGYGSRSYYPNTGYYPNQWSGNSWNGNNWGGNSWAGNSNWSSGFSNTAFGSGRGYGAYRGGYGRWR